MLIVVIKGVQIGMSFIDVAKQDVFQVFHRNFFGIFGENISRLISFWR